jgi:ABC-type lipoprotein export system ATPase subunit
MAGLPLRTRKLVHIYSADGHDVAALAGVDLTVAAGETVGLLGPSGAGKSTLLSLLGGLFRPSAGKVYVGSTDLTAAAPRELDHLRARDVSLMLQGAARNLLPWLTLRENVAFAQRAAHRVTRGPTRRPTRGATRGATVRESERALPAPEEVLADVGLERHGGSRLTALTPGQLQLGAVAVAIAAAPGVLLADEPTSQLDHGARDRVLDTLAAISARHGTTVVVVTHDPAVAARLPRTVTIRDGRIGGEGRSGEEYAVVTEDGFLPVPPDLHDALRPGTLIRFHPVEGSPGEFTIRAEPD